MRGVIFMKHSKKIIAIFMAMAMLFALSACKNKKTEDVNATSKPTTAQKQTVSIAALKGPTGMGISKLAKDSKDSKTQNNYDVTIASSPEDIVSMVSSGKVNMAMCPLNMAAVLYNKTNKNVKMLAVNTLGVLYILENGNTINDIKDLKGKTIYATGQGSTPEYVLNYILEKNGLKVGTDVKIEYKSEHSELAALAASGEVSICMLPEPNVTAATAQNQNLRIAIDLTKEWEKINGEDSTLAQGCIIVNAEFLKNNEKAVKVFLDEYKKSVDFVNSNKEEAAKYIVELGILPKEALAIKAIPNCNITFIAGSEMKKVVQLNLQMLYDSNPQSVGKVLPDDNFYYNAK